MIAGSGSADDASFCSSRRLTKRVLVDSSKAGLSIKGTSSERALAPAILRSDHSCVKKVLVVVGLAVLVLALSAGWQFGDCFLANVELRDDMQDMSSQLGSRIGFVPPGSDEDFREAILRHAKKYGIDLNPGQIIVERTGPENKGLYLAADYRRFVHLPGVTFTLHFTPKAGFR